VIICNDMSADKKTQLSTEPTAVTAKKCFADAICTPGPLLITSSARSLILICRLTGHFFNFATFDEFYEKHICTLIIQSPRVCDDSILCTAACLSSNGGGYPVLGVIGTPVGAYQRTISEKS
jgi:hypothetical protein